MRPSSPGCLRSATEHPRLSKSTVAEEAAGGTDAVFGAVPETLSTSDVPGARGICAVRVLVARLLRDAWQRGFRVPSFPYHHKKGMRARAPGGGICKAIATAPEAAVGLQGVNLGARECSMRFAVAVLEVGFSGFGSLRVCEGGRGGERGCIANSAFGNALLLRPSFAEGL